MLRETWQRTAMYVKPPETASEIFSARANERTPWKTGWKVDRKRNKKKKKKNFKNNA